MTIGRKIESLREARRMSVAELARQLGVSIEAVASWEADADKPDVDMIVAISRLFNVSIDDLLESGFTASNNNDDDDDDDYDFDDDFHEDFVIRLGPGKVVRPNKDSKFTRFLMAIASYNVAVLAYLLMGFIGGFWFYGLAVFPAVWLIRKLIRAARRKSPKLFFTSVFGTNIALVVFLILGFAFSMWHPGWLVFPIFWIIQGIANKT